MIFIKFVQIFVFSAIKIISRLGKAATGPICHVNVCRFASIKTYHDVRGRVSARQNASCFDARISYIVEPTEVCCVRTGSVLELSRFPPRL